MLKINYHHLLLFDKPNEIFWTLNMVQRYNLTNKNSNGQTLDPDLNNKFLFKICYFFMNKYWLLSKLNNNDDHRKLFFL